MGYGVTTFLIDAYRGSAHMELKLQVMSFLVWMLGTEPRTSRTVSTVDH